MGRKVNKDLGAKKTSIAAASAGNGDEQAGATVLPANLLSTDHPAKLPFQRPIVLLNNYIWVLHDFLTRTECQAWIAFMEQPCRKPLDYVKQRGTRYMAARECYRYSQQDACMAHRLFERLRDHTQLLSVLKLPGSAANTTSHSNQQTDTDTTAMAITCNPNLRLYKYCKGHSFGRHIDEANVLPGVGVTRLTVLIYLSECKGGATRFSGNVAFAPQPGAILLHVHGEDLCLEHEADPVVDGIKYVLRTDLVYGS